MLIVIIKAIIFLCLFALSKPTKIAVCITGQRQRFLPKLISRLFEENPNYDFHLFYRFQSGENLTYTTEPGKKFDLSPYSNKTIEKLKHEVNELYSSHTNVYVEYMNNTDPKSFTGWLRHFNVKSLDRITQYNNPGDQVNILNMYDKVKDCGNDIIDFEKQSGLLFDYVIQTREDIYLFKKIDLDSLLPGLQNSKFSSSKSNCDFIARDCITWGGVSMRFNIFEGRKAVQYLSSKIDFYKALYGANRRIFNPEQFDYHNLRHFNFNICGLPIDQMAATGARHTFNENFCFIPQEYLPNCIPSGMHSFIQSKKC